MILATHLAASVGLSFQWAELDETMPASRRSPAAELGRSCCGVLLPWAEVDETMPCRRRGSALLRLLGHRQTAGPLQDIQRCIHMPASAVEFNLCDPDPSTDPIGTLSHKMRESNRLRLVLRVEREGKMALAAGVAFIPRVLASGVGGTANYPPIQMPSRPLPL